MRTPSQTSNTKSVQMKSSDLHRLLTYDQSNETTLYCSYLGRLPTTLLYPEVTPAGVDAYLETIEREYITPLDLQTWQQLQLFLLEPKWLQNSVRRKLRTRLYRHLEERELFIHNIIRQYSDISSFSESVEKQDSLFFTVCALLNISEQIPGMHNTILQYKNGLLQSIKDNPTNWTAFIKGADWLLEELQQSSGALYSFLEQVSVIKLPTKKPANMIQQAMAVWAKSTPNDTLQAADKNLNRINDMLKEVLSDIDSGKRSTNRKK